MGRLWDAIGIAIAINRYSDWGYRPREANTLSVCDDLPRDNRYCDYGTPDRTGHDADESYGRPKGKGVPRVFHAISFIFFHPSASMQKRAWHILNTSDLKPFHNLHSRTDHLLNRDLRHE